jgi:hypothetical protein
MSRVSSTAAHSVSSSYQLSIPPGLPSPPVTSAPRSPRSSASPPAPTYASSSRSSSSAHTISASSASAAPTQGAATSAFLFRAPHASHCLQFSGRSWRAGCCWVAVSAGCAVGPPPSGGSPLSASLRSRWSWLGLRLSLSQCHVLQVLSGLLRGLLLTLSSVRSSLY